MVYGLCTGCVYSLRCTDGVWDGVWDGVYTEGRVGFGVYNWEVRVLLCMWRLYTV